MSGLNINKNIPYYTADILKDAGLSSAVSSRYMDTVINGLPSSEQTGMDTSEYNNLLSDIQNSIQNSPAIDSIARKYTDTLTRGLRDGKTFDEINIDIDEELTTLAAIAYNKAADLVEPKISKKYVRNYIEGASSIEYASIYNNIKLNTKFRNYVNSLTDSIISD